MCTQLLFIFLVLTSHFYHFSTLWCNSAEEEKSMKVCIMTSTRCLFSHDSVSLTRKLLQDKSALDEHFKVVKVQDGTVGFPLVTANLQHDSNGPRISEMLGFRSITVATAEPVQHRNPHKRLQDVVVKYCTKTNDMENYNAMIQDLPKKWERHGDIIVFPENCCTHKAWGSPELLNDIAKVLGCKRLAKQSCISADGYRTPRVTMLLGNNGWTRHVDNHIIYSIDVTKCMFSSGNIPEKLRIASWDCRDLTIVDFNAGIGYFTLPYLVHAKAKHVYAIEWNPDAVEALEINLKLNNVRDRCTILQGDNIKVFPRDIANHVNLGLIPCSRRSWSSAAASINPTTGGIIHIHQNLSTLKPQLKENEASPSMCQRNCSQLETVRFCGGSVTSMVSSNKNIDGPNQLCLVCRQDVRHPPDHKHSLWTFWALKAVKEIESHLVQSHQSDLSISDWTTDVDSIVHIKSYAPHVDHVVVDIRCVPVRGQIKLTALDLL